MNTARDPEAQKDDDKQRLLDVELQNYPHNVTDDANADAARSGSSDRSRTSMTKDQDYTNPETKRETNSLALDLLHASLRSMMLPIYIGVFTVFSIKYTAVANDQSQVANQIALLGLCSNNASFKFCDELLTQSDLYMSNIANKLYGLKATSGKGNNQPIAPPTPVGAVNSTYAVFLENSSLGSKNFMAFQAFFSAAVIGLVLADLWLNLSKVYRLADKKKPQESVVTN